MQTQSNQTHWYEILKKEREHRSWTQEEVAEKIGVAVKSVGRWESGKHLPIALHRRSLCTIYEKTLHELKLDEEPPSNESAQVRTQLDEKPSEEETDQGDVAGVAAVETPHDDHSLPDQVRRFGVR